MSVYDEICEWIADDVAEAIVECDDLSMNDIDWLIKEYIDSNMQDLCDSMLKREKEIRDLVIKTLNGETDEEDE